MIIDLSNLDFDRVEIEFCAPRSGSLRDRFREYPDDYIREREKIWQQQKAVCGDNLWNGTVYTIERFSLLSPNKVAIALSICQYKDLIFKRFYGGDNIIRDYGSDVLVYHTAVLIIPITKDRKYVFGVVAKNGFFEAGKVVLLGGALNYDEGKVNNFEDIRAFAAKELEEETLLKIKPEQLQLASLNNYKFTYHFLFFLQLDIYSKDISTIVKQDELSNLLVFSHQELENLSNSPVSDYVQFYGNYLQYFGDRFHTSY